MGLGDGLGDGQSQTEAAVVAAAGVGAVKPLKQMGQMLLGDGFAQVFGHQLGQPILPPQRQADGRAGGRVFQRVVQQDAHQLAQSVSVTGQGQPLLDVIVQLPVCLVGHRLKKQGRFGHQIAQIHGGKIRSGHTVFRPGKGQHVLHQGAHPPGFRADVVHITGSLPIPVGVLGKQLCRGEYHRQRCFQLVGGVGEEALLFPPDPLHGGGDQTCQQIAAQKQHGHGGQTDQQRGADQGAQRGLFQRTVGEGDADGHQRCLAQIAQAEFLQKSGVLLPAQTGGYDLAQGGLVQLIVAAARYVGRAGGIDFHDKAGQVSLVQPGAQHALAAPLQRQLQLLFGVVAQTGAGGEVNAGKNGQKNQRGKKHGEAHHFPAQLADHSSTSRQ